jgi:DNA-directed RNA polymerase subunit RPC12/RpoP
MKNQIQNVLAQNSNNEISYLCGRCGKEVNKEATICIYCGAKLGNIKCPFCNFEGDINAFKYDTCPKCGRKNNSLKNKSARYIVQRDTVFSKKLFWILLLTLLFLLGLIGFVFLYKFDLV